MFIRKSVKRNKLQKAVFVVLTALIAIGLVIPLASLFQKQPAGGGDQSVTSSQQSLQEKLSGLEAKAKENPGDVNVLMDLAETYLYASKADQAVKIYEQVLALDPNNAEARIDIATIYYYSSKNDQAISQLKELINKDPNNQSAHYLYGIVLGTGKKDYTAGTQELEKFIALAKEGPDVEKAKQIINEWKAAPAQK